MKRLTIALRPLFALFACLAVALCMLPSPAFAASGKVVTLGADLSPEQRSTVLKFFGLSEADLAQLKVINVTNADERAYLAGILDSSIIGDKTYSCSYIQPTDSGGIYVQTANLTYVTNLTLYNALQTAGVKNCNLVVTAPFEVSGTGALTGIFLAYEAQGQQLDEAKKKVASEELVETADLEKTYGESVAELVSDVKNKVVSSAADLSDDQLREVVRTAAASRGIPLSDADCDRIVQLLRELQAIDYDPNTFAQTLDGFISKLNEVTEAAQNSGFFDQIGKFFEDIANWFMGLFNGGQMPSANDISQSAQDFFNSFDTTVFQWDNAQQ